MRFLKAVRQQPEPTKRVNADATKGQVHASRPSLPFERLSIQTQISSSFHSCITIIPEPGAQDFKMERIHDCYVRKYVQTYSPDSGPFSENSPDSVLFANLVTMTFEPKSVENESKKSKIR